MLAFILNNRTNYNPKGSVAQNDDITKYLDCCTSQHSLNIYWYMKAIIIITFVFMVPSIFAMAMATDLYVYSIAITMVLFSTNVLDLSYELSDYGTYATIDDSDLRFKWKPLITIKCGLCYS